MDKLKGFTNFVNEKNNSEFNKVNEEFDILGMDVVITLSELIGGIITTVFIAAGLGFYGYAKLRRWIKDILKSKSKIKALKKLVNLVEKYRDEKVDEYIHDIRTRINYVKNKDERKLYAQRTKFIEMVEYLKDIMTDEDKDEYDRLTTEIGLYGQNFKTYTYGVDDDRAPLNYTGKKYKYE